MREMRYLFLALLFVGCSGESSKSSTPPVTDGGVVLDGGGVIPDPPDGAAACQSAICNYQTQDCANGATCIPVEQPPATGPWPPGCFAPGTKAAGESCSTWTECVLGHFCVGISSSGPGVCRKLCCGGDWSACPPSESCYRPVQLVRPGSGEIVESDAYVCAPADSCDPLNPSDCAALNETCQIVDPIGHAACLPEGTAGPGESCATENCQGGSICTGQKCRRLCKAAAGGGEPSCPPSEGVCIHFAHDPAGVGECTPIE
jgi:hypothetical protein